MAQTLSGLIAQLRTDLDTAYGNDPNQDFEALKTTLISSYLPSAELDPDYIIQLAAMDPEDCFSDYNSVAADAYSVMEGLMEAAFDEELGILETP